MTKSFQSGGRGEFKRGEFKKGEFRKGGSFEKGALKRSDNPDVIYGRDFEEEAMKIEELIGDMGGSDHPRKSTVCGYQGY